MTKAALVFLGTALVLFAGNAFAQDNAAINAADNEAVIRQANVILLRQKLADAKAASLHGDRISAAKLYTESCTLAETIGSGAPEETVQSVAGLTAVRLDLARDAQGHGDLHEANIQVTQILNAENKLKVNPNGEVVLAFKKHNDELLVMYKGRMPDTETLDKVPQLASQKVAASTLIQDAKVYYEAGEFNQAELKLNQAVAMDPDNTTASYYLNLIQQEKIKRDSVWHNTDTGVRMERVERQWILPKSTANLPVPNAYATNNLVFTGPGRQAIMTKLDKIHLETVSFDGLPLNEVLKQLTAQCKLRDPERIGINFLINNNPDLSGQPIAAPAAIGNVGIGGNGAGGMGGMGGIPGGGGAAIAAPAATALDPATGLPMAPAESAAAEPVDVGSFLVKIPSLNNVRLADVLDAIVLVADHPIKYSVRDFAIVFSAKGPETPQLFSRTFRVDPNTFYSGLENVSAQSFGSVSSSGSSGSSSSSSGSGGGNNNNGGAVVGVVNAFAGAGSYRSSGGSSGGGGGGGGGGGSQGGSGSLLNPTSGGSSGGGGGGGGGGGSSQNEGGLAYITSQTSEANPSALARAFFTTLGVNLLYPAGKSVFFNERLGVLFVKATETDLDTIERALQVLNQVPPQVHIKARFIEVSQSDDNELGFDWYLGQFNLGNEVVGQGGTSASSAVGTSAANSTGYFPGSTTANVISGASTDQQVTSGLRNSAPTLATFTGIMTDPNFRVAIRALSQRTGVETLGEPEITVISGRQTQMRATSVVSVVIGLNFQQGTAASTTTGTSTTQ
jgi:tetratricopeptide (TPR) repeat protein